MSEQMPTKEREIEVEGRTEKVLPNGGKTVYNITDADGVRYVAWDKKLYDTAKGRCKVRYYSSKKGEFTNNTITAIAPKTAEGFGDWVEAERQQGNQRRGFARSPEDQSSIETQCCLKAAVELVKGSYTPKTAQDTVDMAISAAKRFKAEFFGAQAPAPKLEDTASAS